MVSVHFGAKFGWVGPRLMFTNLITRSRRRGGVNMVVAAAGAIIKEGTSVCSTILLRYRHVHAAD